MCSSTVDDLVVLLVGKSDARRSTWGGCLVGVIWTVTINITININMITGGIRGRSNWCWCKGRRGAFAGGICVGVFAALVGTGCACEEGTSVAIYAVLSLLLLLL